MESTLETSVGIEQYLNKDICTGGGLQGIIKHKFSDFAVNEISSEGCLVKLKNLGLPAVDVVKPVPSDDEVIYQNQEVSKKCSLKDTLQYQKIEI